MEYMAKRAPNRDATAGSSTEAFDLTLAPQEPFLRTPRSCR